MTQSDQPSWVQAEEPERARQRRSFAAPLELPAIIGQAALLLGFVLALYAAVAPRIGGAEGARNKVAADELGRYVEGKLRGFQRDLEARQAEGDKLLEAQGKKKKTFSEKWDERRKQLRAYRSQLEADFDLAGKRRAAARAAGAGKPRTWTLFVGAAGLILLSLGALMLMWQAPRQVSKVSYLIMLCIGLLVGGIGLRMPEAEVTDGKIKTSKRLDNIRIELNRPIALPSDHRRLTWAVTVAALKTLIPVTEAGTKQGLVTFKTRDGGAAYGFRAGKLEQITLNQWSQATLDALFVGSKVACRSRELKFLVGGDAETVMVQLGRQAIFAKVGTETATKLNKQMREVCEALNKADKLRNE